MSFDIGIHMKKNVLYGFNLITLSSIYGKCEKIVITL